MGTFTIRRDTFNGFARSWVADFTFSDGEKEIAFVGGYKTKAELVSHISAMPGGEHQIVRGVDTL